MKKVSLAILLGTAFFVLSLQGVVPQKWELRNKDDFLKGKFDGISVSYEGILSLSPKEDKIEGPSEDFYLSFLLTSDGISYLGTGHGGKVYRITKEGKAEVYFQTSEMDVSCLALDRKGNLYAGTSPNGKIYKITEKGKGEVFFDPAEKYVWDLLFTEKGTLMAAVGESGGIYEINQEGEGTLALKAEENHILCLKADKSGNLIAGSSGNGVVYRISTGKASVVFESPYEEIKDLALDQQGNIYAAAAGTSAKPKKEETPAAPLKSETEVTLTVTPSLPDVSGILPSTAKNASALYKINPDGLAKCLWSSSEELIYTVLWNEGEKKILFGTGSKGRIYTIDNDEKISLLLQENSEQVYSLLAFDSKIYAMSNNPSHLSVFYPELRTSGEYLSSVLDTETISSWGRMEWAADVPAGTTVQLQTRSGNTSEPDATWNDWSPPYQKMEEQVLSPKARYLQFKILFKSQTGKISPSFQKVILFYLQSNLAPKITKLELLAPNEVFLKPPEQDEVIWGIQDSSAGVLPPKKDETKSVMIAKKVERKGFQTLTWDAEDENGDTLFYSLSIRKEGETQWRLLKDNWTENIFTFDTLAYPDGVYFVKLTASDAPSNPQGTELRAEKISQPLLIDNSLPVIKSFLATKDKNTLEVTFEAEDAFSYIEEVKYLIRPNDWRVVFPTDGICDSKLENFKLRIPLAPNSENLITIKVMDSHHNIGVYMQAF
jgi:hypothetical protein